MTDKTVASLPAADTLTGAEKFYLVQNGTDKQTTIDVLRTQAKGEKGDKGDQGDTGATGDVTPEAQAAADAAAASAAAAATYAGSIGSSQDVSFGTIVTTGSDLSGYTIMRQSAATYAGKVYRVRIAAAGVGTATIYVLTLSGATVSAITASKTVTLAAGLNTIYPDLAIAAGQYCAVYASSAKFQNGSGGPAAWIKSGTLAAGNTVTNSTSHKHEIDWQFESGMLADVDATKLAVATYDTVIGATQTLGWQTIVATGSDLAANTTQIDQEPATVAMTARGITIGAAAGGTMTVAVVTMSGLTATVLSTQTVTFIAGVHEYPLALSVPAGAYMGWWGSPYKYQSGSNPTGRLVWFKSGALSSGQTVASASSHRFEIQFRLTRGMQDDIQRLGASGSGTTLLSTADSTGASDVTSAFSDAASLHPTPYVPPGTFAVTSLPNTGDGFWGPGAVQINGNRWFIPPAPRGANLYRAIRDAFAYEMTNSAPLIFLGDSITQYAKATTAANNWVYLLTSFANGVASPTDLPVITSLQSYSTYTPAFNGISYTGTVSAGTNGPVGDLSAVMAAGSVMTFTGAYETLGVWYCKGSGAGTLTVARNGSTIATINANAATDLNAYSGAIATGNTASATYTVTVSTASVEVTGIGRWAALSPTNRSRLVTVNAGHGDWTFSSFTTTRLAAALKMAAGLSATKPAVVIALGTNDRGTPAATMKANAESVVDYLIAQGVTKIYGVMPNRPAGSKDIFYDSSQTYDTCIGTLSGVYKARGVTILPVHRADYANRGLLDSADLLHPIDTGHATMAQLFCEGLAA